MIIDETRIAKTGEWLYDGTTPCKIIIIHEDMFPGTGDHEDPPEIADDQDVPCVSIWYENLAKRGDYNAGGGYARTIEDAVKAVERTIRSKVVWKS
jgi:hypothetical protein